MEFCFKRRWRLLKTCLSMSFLLATLMTIHKLTLGEEGGKGRLDLNLKTNVPRYLARHVSTQQMLPGANLSRPGLGPTERHLHLNRATQKTPQWDITKISCPENQALRKQPWFMHLDRRFHQYMLHRHCRYFPILLNHPEKCHGDVHLLIVVKSIIEQYDRREAIRKTWGREMDSEGKKIRTLFLLGSTSSGKDHRNLQRLIQQEDQIHRDILQWDFMDTFFNLTLKEVNFLKWFHIYCPSVEFIFKGDDDIFVQTRNVLDFLDFQKEEPNLANLFVGDIITKAAPIRNKRSKYYIPREVYAGSYPLYAGGGGFLMASSLAKRLLPASEKIQLFPIDDVFLGMCLRAVGVQPKAHSGFRTFGISRKRLSPMNTDPCFYRGLLVVHRLSAEELMKMWQVVHNGKLNCTKRVDV
ncbi:UDP-GlcNAc:betaGal beta-1,3-N-acetylglucosaminyltransferase 7-like [Ambystoma mexicanum]|uniref:UDP-GlcNAc:betaGal beta-1,3-N-acetylglucosaminyltransferase 7-like n=1 Tax=Ambystoma mexicanum TaxID=8296 RepID=UPI0037E7E299